MKNEYQIIYTNSKGFVRRYKEKINSSDDFWLKYAKQREKEGFYVSIDFEYYSDIKQICMRKFEAVNRITFEKEIILIKKQH